MLVFEKLAIQKQSVQSAFSRFCTLTSTSTLSYMRKKSILLRPSALITLLCATFLSVRSADAQYTTDHFSFVGYSHAYDFNHYLPATSSMAQAVQYELGVPVTVVSSLPGQDYNYPPIVANTFSAPYYTYAPAGSGQIKNSQLGSVVLNGILRGQIVYAGTDQIMFFTCNRFVLRVFTATKYHDILIKVLGATGAVDNNGQRVPGEQYYVSWSTYTISGPRDIVTPELVNLSTRARVLTGQNVLIAGMYISGTVSKKIVIRGIGPSLSNYGISGAMADPTIELRNSAGTLLASNDNWQQSTQYQEIQSSGFAPSNYYESAIIATLAPGSYTTTLQGVGGTTGVGVVEVYDLQPANSKLVNLSSRAYVDTGDNAVFAGLYVSTGSPSDLTARLAIRGIGPTLGNYGLSNTLQDPTLELRNASGTLIASNNNWQDSQASEIQSAGMAPGNYYESVIIRLLSPGSYTAILRGYNNTVGTGSIEIYRLQ